MSIALRLSITLALATFVYWAHKRTQFNVDEFIKSNNLDQFIKDHPEWWARKWAESQPNRDR